MTLVVICVCYHFWVASVFPQISLGALAMSTQTPKCQRKTNTAGWETSTDISMPVEN